MSTKTYCVVSSVRKPGIRCRVVCAFGLTAARCSPTRAFRSVDSPRSAAPRAPRSTLASRSAVLSPTAAQPPAPPFHLLEAAHRRRIYPAPRGCAIRDVTFLAIKCSSGGASGLLRAR